MPETVAARPDRGERGYPAALAECRDPADLLARLGVTLRLQPKPLRLPGKQVWGAWDPLLRRIELFGCEAARSDVELVRTLGHEIGHVLHDDRITGMPGSEIAAERFAERWLELLGPAGVRHWAAALRGPVDVVAGLLEAGDEAA